mgnify:CR=1 FL=1
MPSVDKLLSNLNKIDLLPVQQKVLNKLMQKPFEIAKKGSYEPLYDLLKTMFVTEYPNFQISKEIAHLYFENDVENKQSAYGNFQSYALMFYSYFSEENIKKEVYHKITQHADPIVLQKRIDRCKEETLLKKTLQAYHQLSSTKKMMKFIKKGLRRSSQLYRFCNICPMIKNKLTACIKS